MEESHPSRSVFADRFARIFLLFGAVALAAAAALSILIFTGFFGEEDGYSGPGTVTGFGNLDLAALGPTATPLVAPSRAPIAQIIIPKIDVDAPVVVKGIDANNVMEAPDGPWDVAWYDFTAKPGFGSNAVFSGHVDYINVGPAVFWGVKDLEKNDLIEVRLEDGTAYRYRVSAMQTVEADSDVSGIVGPTDREVITLITCIGTFDQATGQYDQRLIVRAERTGGPPSATAQ